MTTLELLQKARKRIEKPENWTQNTFARGVKRPLVNVISPSALSWCAIGACQAECSLHATWSAYSPAITALSATKSAKNGISFFNDTSTHADVMEMYDEAIHNLS